MDYDKKLLRHHECTTKKAFLDKYGDRATYSYVAEDIWIGDIGASVAVAKGTLLFDGVYNASSMENCGVSLEGEYKTRGILYETSWMSENGLTFEDGKFNDPFDVAIAMWISGGCDHTVDVDSRDHLTTDVPVKTMMQVSEKNGKALLISPLTKIRFYAFVFRAARLISSIHDTLALLRTQQKVSRTGNLQTEPKILVHCMAGKNRSAASIVAYFMLRKDNPMTYNDALNLLEHSNVKRHMPVLTNTSFREALSHLTSIVGGSIQPLLEEETRTIKSFCDVLSSHPLYRNVVRVPSESTMKTPYCITSGKEEDVRPTCVGSEYPIQCLGDTQKDHDRIYSGTWYLETCMREREAILSGLAIDHSEYVCISCGASRPGMLYSIIDEKRVIFCSRICQSVYFHKHIHI